MSIFEDVKNTFVNTIDTVTGNKDQPLQATQADLDKFNSALNDTSSQPAEVLEPTSTMEQLEEEYQQDENEWESRTAMEQQQNEIASSKQSEVAAIEAAIRAKAQVV